MSGFNEKLPKEEKIQCLLCLSSKKPQEKENGISVCPDCGATNTPFVQTLPQNESIKVNIQENS